MSATIESAETVVERPPEYPWEDLHPDSNASSPLGFYYSSQISPLAVRDVNRTTIAGGAKGLIVADCKSDPNFETGTFGLFSTCQAQTRQGIVKRRSPYMFFFCKRNFGDGLERCVSGYYQLGWFAHGGTHRGDYCIAASYSHFVANPLTFKVINEELGTEFNNQHPRRVMCMIEPHISLGLRQMLERQPNVVDDYITEVRRLENLNARVSGGLRYINFGRRAPFDWNSVGEYTLLGTQSEEMRIPNGSPTCLWHCSSCDNASVSQSRLKLCPSCKVEGTLAAFQNPNN